MGNYDYDYTKIKTGDYNYDYEYTKFGKADYDYDYNNHCNRLQMIMITIVISPMPGVYVCMWSNLTNRCHIGFEYNTRLK